jgi:protocatechuate 3,4-dioxygenase beta subunit
MTKHAGYGIGAPHLHFEVVVAEGLGKELVTRGILQEEGVKQKEWKLKAKFANIAEREALQSIRHQVNTWAIRGVYKDYMIKVGAPQYKKSIYSKVGIGLTYIIDPTLFVGQ